MDTSKKNKNTLPSGIKCCIRKCKKSKRHNAGLKMFKFPGPDMTFGQIWRQKCHIPKEDYEKTLYICENHFASCDVGRKKLKADAIPTIDLDEMLEKSEDIVQTETTNEVEFAEVKYTIEELAEEPKVVNAAEANESILPSNENSAIMDSLQEQQPNITQPDACQQHLTLAWALKLTKMSHTQRIIAEKLINEVMFNGELGLLNFNTGLSNVNSVNNPDSFNNIKLEVETKQEIRDL